MESLDQLAINKKWIEEIADYNWGKIVWFTAVMGNPNRFEGQIFAKKPSRGPKYGLLLYVLSIFL